MINSTVLLCGAGSHRSPVLDGCLKKTAGNRPLLVVAPSIGDSNGRRRRVAVQLVSASATSQANPQPGPLLAFASLFGRSLGAAQILASKLNGAMKAAARKIEAVDADVVNEQIRENARNMRQFAAVLPLASVTGSNAFLLVTKAVSSFIKLYLLLLFLRVLLSWFPTFKWDRNPWIILRQVTDPYLNLFRGLVPPLLGTIDFTPLLGFIILQWLVGALDIGEEDRYW